MNTDNYDNELLQMANAIKKFKILYIEDFVKYCLRFNWKWFDLIVNDRTVQYQIIMLLEDFRESDSHNPQLNMNVI